MGTKPPRPDTLEPEILKMIDRYVSDVMEDTPARGRRFARASEAGRSVDDFMAPPSIDPDTVPAPVPAAAMVYALAAVMDDAPEFVDESPTDLSSPPQHVPGDDEDTAVYALRRRD